MLEKFLPDDLKTEMYLAKAHYHKGDYETCKKIVIKLISKHPNCIPLRFDLALCLYQQADKIFNLDVRRVVQTKQAIGYLNNSLKLFKWVERNFQA